MEAGGDAGARVTGGLVVAAAGDDAVADVDEFGGATGDAASVVSVDELVVGLTAVAFSLWEPDEHAPPNKITSTAAAAQRCIIDILALPSPASWRRRGHCESRWRRGPRPLAGRSRRHG